MIPIVWERLRQHRWFVPHLECGGPSTCFKAFVVEVLYSYIYEERVSSFLMPALPSSSDSTVSHVCFQTFLINRFVLDFCKSHSPYLSSAGPREHNPLYAPSSGIGFFAALRLGSFLFCSAVPVSFVAPTLSCTAWMENLIHFFKWRCLMVSSLK